MVERSDTLESPYAAVLAEDLRGFVRKLKRLLRQQALVGASDTHTVSRSWPSRAGRSGDDLESRPAGGMRPQSMGAVITSLEAAGLVKGAPDPEDGRQTLLSLTDSCRQRIREDRAARQDWLQRTIAARLSREEQRQVVAAVELLTRLVDD